MQNSVKWRNSLNQFTYNETIIAGVHILTIVFSYCTPCNDILQQAQYPIPRLSSVTTWFFTSLVKLDKVIQSKSEAAQNRKEVLFPFKQTPFLRKKWKNLVLSLVLALRFDEQILKQNVFPKRNTKAFYLETFKMKRITFTKKKNQRNQPKL